METSSKALAGKLHRGSCLSVGTGGKMKDSRKRRRRLAAAALTALFLSLTGCVKPQQETAVQSEPVELVWYQIGAEQPDGELVEERVNAYTKEKIGVTVDIRPINFNDYNSRMRSIINTGAQWDLAFSSSWANDYLEIAQKGALLPLNDLLSEYGTGLLEEIDDRFWKAATINGEIYGVPSQKEIGNMPMWVFTKEYVDKYNIPYQDIHTLEDLEPWLKLIAEKEPDVVPLYLTSDFSAPTYMDKIIDPVGIEYGDETLTVKNVFETERMRKTLRTLHRYFQAGYINPDAAVARDDKTVKRFVTKGDGQPYAETVWSNSLGYEVVASQIMETQVTNASARGALTVISRDCKNPEKAVEFLNLVNTDLYLRNLLNYGIEGVHYTKVAVEPKEMESCRGKRYIYGCKARLLEGSERYSVSYYVQGGLFSTWVLETDPLDKWDTFVTYNDNSVEAPTFGFDFDASAVQTQISNFRIILDEYGPALYTGSVDPDVYVPRLIEKLEENGIQDVIDEMQRQIDSWRESSKGTDRKKEG